LPRSAGGKVAEGSVRPKPLFACLADARYVLRLTLDSFPLVEMSDVSLEKVALALRDKMEAKPISINHGRRIPSEEIFGILEESIRPLLETCYGNPIFCRYSGGGINAIERGRDTGGFKVKEYLVDFSFSRFSIPQAIGDLRAGSNGQVGFKLLFTAESELGSEAEVCRDLLKLLDTRAEIRCLIYRKRSSLLGSNRLRERIVATLKRYADFDSIWRSCIFVELRAREKGVECSAYKLDFEKGGGGFVELA